MGEIILNHVNKVYEGGEHAVKDVDLTIEDGSFTVIVGPSGSGKSTLLRMIAGLETVSEGEIIIDGRVVNDVPARDRDIAMVFQNYALYPSMTVRENIEFGLKNRGIAKAERDELIANVSNIVDLNKHLDKKPSQLSGGQRQRVALARAMVKKPRVFILDEPLSNLDAKLRVQMRTQLIELHKELGTTFIYVTHDQIEAMSMGTDIILLDFGVVQQYSSPHVIYNQPDNLFTATFMGTPPMNIMKREDLFDHQIEKLGLSDQVGYIGFRPEHAKIIYQSSGNPDVIDFIGDIRASEMLGSETVHAVQLSSQRVSVKDIENQVHDFSDCMVEVPIHRISYFDQQGNRIKVGENYVGQN